MRICSFPGAREIGKPKDWDEQLDGACLSIFVADDIDVQSGLPVMYTLFKPSPEQIDALLRGGVLRLGIVGQRQHPVFNMCVLSPDLVERCGVVPEGDLGGEVIP